MDHLAIGGNIVCFLIIFIILIGLGRAYISVAGDFEFIIWGDNPKRDGTIFMGKLTPEDTM